jgi:NADH-quinone oxidoreductase subunit J
MDFKTLLFYMLSAVMIFAAFRVVTARNPVHAALFLVLAFFQASGLWLLLQAEFLAVALIVVYVGAVMVLFLFVVMMLDINIESVRRGFWNHLPVGATIGGLMVFEMLTAVKGIEVTPELADPAGYSNTKELGRLLYTEFAYPFELASVILLVAIVAAVVLTHRKRKDSKQMRVGDQLAVRREDRIRMVNMASEKETVE